MLPTAVRRLLQVAEAAPAGLLVYFSRPVFGIAFYATPMTSE